MWTVVGYVTQSPEGSFMGSFGLKVRPVPSYHWSYNENFKRTHAPLDSISRYSIQYKIFCHLTSNQLSTAPKVLDLSLPSRTSLNQRNYPPSLVPGSDLTLFAWCTLIHQLLWIWPTSPRFAPTLPRITHNFSLRSSKIELIDLNLRPILLWDIETTGESVQMTKRYDIVHEAGCGGWEEGFVEAGGGSLASGIDYSTPVKTLKKRMVPNGHLCSLPPLEHQCLALSELIYNDMPSHQSNMSFTLPSCHALDNISKQLGHDALLPHQQTRNEPLSISRHPKPSPTLTSTHGLLSASHPPITIAYLSFCHSSSECT